MAVDEKVRIASGPTQASSSDAMETTVSKEPAGSAKDTRADASEKPDRNAGPKGKLHEALDGLVVAKQALADGQQSIASVQRSVEELGKGTARLEEALEDLAGKQAEVSHQATHDELTGLPNRALLLDRFEQAVAQAGRHGKPVALLFVDLDHFKGVNDKHGHRVGDHVLREIAVRLRASVRAGDTAGRHGGDEFVILLTSFDAQQNAATVAEKVREGLGRPYVVGSVELDLMASIGIAQYPEHGTSWNDLVHHADMDMYRLRSTQRARMNG